MIKETHRGIDFDLRSQSFDGKIDDEALEKDSHERAHIRLCYQLKGARVHTHTYTQRFEYEIIFNVISRAEGHSRDWARKVAV